MSDCFVSFGIAGYSYVVMPLFQDFFIEINTWTLKLKSVDVKIQYCVVFKKTIHF